MLKFYYNGIKDTDTDGKLQRCWYSDTALISYPAGTITIYARTYAHFSKGVHAAFRVENDTDIMTDYIQADLIRVEPSHALYNEVHVALTKQKTRQNKKVAA